MSRTTAPRIGRCSHRLVGDAEKPRGAEKRTAEADAGSAHHRWPDEKVTRMIRVSIDGADGNSRFSVSVCADNLRRAVGFVVNRYPDRAVAVMFPSAPDTFFVEDPTVEAGMVEVMTA
jgi:hypothetical protein